MRDTIIFSGQSNTFGLGLEWELDPELNDDGFLSKGVTLPFHTSRYQLNQNYWRPYRWPKLVCNELGYKEYNVHDMENGGRMGGGAADTLWHLLDRSEQLIDVLDITKYVILEIGYIRWWDKELHGKKSGEELPNTPIEIENYINSKNPDKEVVKKAIDWIGQYDSESFWKQTYNKVKIFSEKFPEIKIILVPWSGHGLHDFISNNELSNSMKDYYVDIGNYPSIMNYLTTNKLCVYHKAKAFNGNYKYNYKDDHASIEGQQKVAEMVIQHIKKLENEDKK